MSNNKLIIIEGSLILTKYLAPFVADIMQKEIGDVWWKQAIETAFERDPYLKMKIPQVERVNALDFRRCKILINVFWQRFFRHHLPQRFQTNLLIAYEIYNRAKHTNNQSDMPESETMQAISTMCLLMEDLNNTIASNEIRMLIKKVGSDINENISLNRKPIKKTTDFSAKVIELANSINAGEIATYGDLSQMISGKGNKNYSQTIATIIKNNADQIISCHRIVGAEGSIKTSGKYNDTGYTQGQLLEHEGISVVSRNGKEYADVKKRKWPDMVS